jgi:2-amino-4-hydroxy-6-hydroxymethyldihydropteridine diphosphokinase
LESKVFLALGSNLGNKYKNLKNAEILLEEKGIRILKRSKIYITPPFGYTEQDDFLNECLIITTNLSPRELLNKIHEIEKGLKRKRKIHWGPRTIDIDILFYEDKIIDEEDLKIPHPGIPERDFVLRPLMDLDPDFIHPILKKRIKNLYSEIEDKCVPYDEHYILG